MTVTADAKPTQRARRWWARRLIGPAVALVVVIGTFAFVLPQVADYASVWDAIQTMSIAELALLVVVSAWNLASVGPVLMTAFPGLRFWEAMTVAQTGTSLSSALPGGEVVAYGMVYRMYRSFRLSVSEVAQGLVISGMFDNLAKFSMPFIAFICVRITGDSSDSLGAVAIIGMGLLVAMIVLAVGVLRSEDFARRWGDRVQRWSAGPLRWLKKPPLEDLGERVVDFRRESIGLLRSRWGLLTFGAYLSELSVYLVLLVSVRVVGVTEHQVSWSLVLASFSLVRILQSVPITPGGIGVVELGLTGALVAAGGDNANVVAGVLVYRALTWLPPLVLGPFFYGGWRLWLRRQGLAEPSVDEVPSLEQLVAEVEEEGLEAFAEGEKGPSHRPE
ncbi:MAG: lysylphosphatidylglycerol synthase transmembrane domain-containing protein [Acidimicrobiales bacterium]